MKRMNKVLVKAVVLSLIMGGVHMGGDFCLKGYAAEISTGLKIRAGVEVMNGADVKADKGAINAAGALATQKDLEAVNRDAETAKETAEAAKADIETNKQGIVTNKENIEKNTQAITTERTERIQEVQRLDGRIDGLSNRTMSWTDALIKSELWQSPWPACIRWNMTRMPRLNSRWRQVLTAVKALLRQVCSTTPIKTSF